MQGAQPGDPVSRFDRYLLSQQLALFGFFSLVLVMVYWINRAVGLFDKLIADGQSALVFLEFSLLALPNVIRIVLPVSAFAATVYVTNRLAQDGELVVMQATGFSAFRLARPVLIFGVTVALMLLFLANFAVPASRATLSARTAEVEANVTAQLLSDGRFMHPTDGITFYIREISTTGELLDVFLVDDRSGTMRTTYTAARAILVRGDGAPKLVMFDGMSQTLARATRRLTVTRFSDFTYDLGTFVRSRRSGRDLAEELSTATLLFPDDAVLAAVGTGRAALLAEAHSRLAQPLLGVAAVLLGFSTLLLGAFSRFGLARQILASIVLLIAVQMVYNASTGAALRDDRLWVLVYAAPVLGIAGATALLALAQRPRRLRTGAVAA